MNKDTTSRAKVALVQLVAGAVMTTLSLFFKSILLFVVSLIIFGMGVNGIVKIVKAET